MSWTIKILIESGREWTLTGERHEQAQDVVGALEDAEDAQVAQHALQPRGLHEAHAAQDLDGLVHHGPRGVRREHLPGHRFR